METAEAASQEDQQVVPMADSLVERAKLVVETNFVDEEFAVRCREDATGGSSCCRTQVQPATVAAGVPAALAGGLKPVIPCFLAGKLRAGAGG